MNSAVPDAGVWPDRVQVTSTVSDPVAVAVTSTVRSGRPAPDVETPDSPAVIVPAERAAVHADDHGDTVNPPDIAPGASRDPPTNPEMLTRRTRATKLAETDADRYPLRLHVTVTVTVPVPAVVTDTRRDDPELSENDTDAEIPERLAEHVAFDGDTVKPSDIEPAPSRESPSQPETDTPGRAAHVIVSLILSVSDASLAHSVAVPSDVHDNVPVFEREYVVMPNNELDISLPCDSRSDTPSPLDHHSLNEFRLLFAEPTTTNDVPSLIEHANASSNPDGVLASEHDPPDDTETEIPVTFAPAGEGDTTTPATATIANNSTTTPRRTTTPQPTANPNPQAPANRHTPNQPATHSRCVPIKATCKHIHSHHANTNHTHPASASTCWRCRTTGPST